MDGCVQLKLLGTGDISVFFFAAGEDSVFKDEFINNSSHLVARGSLSEKLTIFVL